MAQGTLGQVPDLDMREAEEIERLLREQEDRGEENILPAHPLKRFLNQKRFLGLAAAILLVWGTGLVLLSLMDRNSEVSQVSPVEQAPVQGLISAAFQIQKPNIYPLKSFFVPILSKNKETGKFLHVTAHLVLSNRRLRKDIDKVRPLIRHSVYTVISRKNIKDFGKAGVSIEEKIKREILTTSNSFLLSGTGTITNVIFTEFIVSPS
jgi:flagellar basal body-associated protein FliL